MKKIIFLLLLLCFSVSLVHAKNIRVLAIGNSFSYDAIEHYLSGLVEASGDTIVIGNAYIAGCSLERHFNNMTNNTAAYSYHKIVDGIRTETPSLTLIDIINDEDWDYVSLQQVSSLSGDYKSYYPFIVELSSFVKEHSTNPSMEIVLHATWAYAQNSTHSGFANYDNNQTIMYDAIVDATSRVALKEGINMIIPSGTAIQNGRTSILGDTFCKDGYHLEITYGRYTAACAWYEKLFEKSVIGNSYIPDNISKLQAKIAQYAAHYAIIIPNHITEISIE